MKTLSIYTFFNTTKLFLRNIWYSEFKNKSIINKTIIIIFLSIYLTFLPLNWIWFIIWIYLWKIYKKLKIYFSNKDSFVIHIMNLKKKEVL